ncbi:MAG: formyltetrahydrofolate deformylase [Vulcanimicrobiaceae bacterium]
MQLGRSGISSAPTPGAVLTLSCDDVAGIVHAVAGFLLDAGCNIVDSAQFRDDSTQRFFMRVDVVPVAGAADAWDVARLRERFAAVATRFAMTWEVRDRTLRSRLVVLVSQHGHCLNDLLYRYGTGDLFVDIPAIVSNHSDLEPLARAYGVPFHHVAVTAATKADAEARLLAIARDAAADLVVLARYMQILSPDLCDALEGRAINIHHSFLPSFAGAKPYHQAYARGVKIIGATAHYVTRELDEGPIVEQDVAHVTHAASPADLVATGRNIESAVLSRAVTPRRPAQPPRTGVPNRPPPSSELL